MKFKSESIPINKNKKEELHVRISNNLKDFLRDVYEDNENLSDEKDSEEKNIARAYISREDFLNRFLNK